MRFITYTQCPRLEVPGVIWQLMRAATLAEKGSWPIAGGWMEQTHACVEGTTICWAEKSRWESRQVKQSNV